MATKRGFGKATGEYHRPRRPSTETVRYLRSLPLQLDVALDEIQAFLQDGDNATTEYPAAMQAALSALDEIGNEIASLAAEEHASAVVEIIVRIAVPVSELAARKLVAACSGYAVFLATHRYGSHVLQTILQTAITAETASLSSSSSSSSSLTTRQDLALHADAPALTDVDELPTLTQALLALHAELLPHVSSLAVHVCGSHILRTLCCILSGYQQTLTSTSQYIRRGGKSKTKQIDKIPADPRLVPVPPQNSRIDPKQEDIQAALQELVTAISGDTVLPPGTLQEVACDSSASPLLMVMLRVLTYRHANNVGEISTIDTEASNSGPNHHLVLIPSEPHFRSGSQAEALAHRLLCWQTINNQKDDDCTQQPYTSDVIYGLAGEPRGSHVLDTLVRLASDELYHSILQAGGFLEAQTLTEYIQHDVSNFVVQTILGTIRTSEQAMQLSNLLLDNATLIFDPARRRRGILWRWAEMAVSFPACQPRVLQAITAALQSLQPRSCKMSKHCAPSLLGINDWPSDTDRLVLNVEGTRTLFHLLRFDRASEVAESVLALSTVDLERLAKDGLGSRCVWDAILEEASSVALLRKKLLSKLQGRWVALATDRVGHHVVRKLFLALSDMTSREYLVKELSEHMIRLEGNAMGRKIAAGCCVREYTMRGKHEWERCVSKTAKEKEWLQEMLHSEPKKRSNDRKHGSQTEETVEKSKRIKEMSMGDIVNAISMPKKP